MLTHPSRWRFAGAALVAAILCGAALIASCGRAKAVTSTRGKATLTFTTTAAGGRYAPKHVLAVWVADSQGGFVKTLLVRAKKRKRYLYRWKKDAGSNVVDAVSGATLKSHGSRTAKWDCTDVDGNLVADGDYTVQIEFTDKHARGPTTPASHISFAKGAEAVTTTPEDRAHYNGITLVYAPASEASAAEAEIDEAGPADATVFATGVSGSQRNEGGTR